MAAFSDRFLSLVSKLQQEELLSLVWYYAEQATLSGWGASHNDEVCEVLEQDIATMRETMRGNDELTRGDA